MKNLLINFSTMKKGGGLNVSMNFLYAFRSVPSPFRIFFMVSEASPQLEYLQNNLYKDFVVVPANPIKRILWEAFVGWRWLAANKIDVVYSYFGYAFFLSGVKQVTGSADSNLYFPEVDFWEGHKGIARIKKALIDFYRLFCVKRAAGVVYENAAMLERAKKLFGLNNVVFIKPSIKVLSESKGDRSFDFGDDVTALFLCDWHTNKNVMLIPDLLLAAKERNINFKIAMSANFDNSALSTYVKNRLVELELMDKFVPLGAVSKQNLAALYASVDAVMLLSKLESFSNNIIEAWSYQKPLIVADEEWSRAICGTAAFYVPRNDVDAIVTCLQKLQEQPDLSLNYLKDAGVELSSYPSIEERIKLEYEFLKGLTP